MKDGKKEIETSGQEPLCPYCNQKIEYDGCLCRDSVFTIKSTNNAASEEQSDEIFPDSAYDLLTKLLDLDPDTRISAADALQHSFITDLSNE